MPSIHSVIEISAPPGPLWDLSQDYYLRTQWDPFIREVKLLDGATRTEVGVRSWVRAHNGLTMTVKYITARRPDQVAMTMTEGPRLFEKFSGAWGFEPLEAGHTRVKFSYHFLTRPRLLRPLVEPVVRRFLQRDMDARLAALKRAVETTDLLARRA